MDEKKILNDETLAEVSGGVMSVQEEDMFLDSIEDPDRRYAWDAAIHYLYNYKDCDFRTYQGYLNNIVPAAFKALDLKISPSEFRDICERAYLKFYCKIHSK